VAGSHSLVGAGYRAGGTATLAAAVSAPAGAAVVGWQIALPPGWKFLSSPASGGVAPAAGAGGVLLWSWTGAAVASRSFHYTVSVPAGETGPRSLRAEARIRLANGEETVFPVAPTPLVVDPVVTHDADTDRDQRLSLVELTRVIELYNVRAGTVRTGAYAVALAATEDGFALDPARGDVPASLLRFHHADTDRDARLGLGELTRIIQLYNHRAAAVRTGQYRSAPGTEDGFAPGP